jgi:hypothetical protein
MVSETTRPYIGLAMGSCQLAGQQKHLLRQKDGNYCVSTPDLL